MGCDWHKIYNDTWNRHKEAQAIGMDHNAPEYRTTCPIKLIGTPFMGVSNSRQRVAFFISKGFIEELYSEMLTVKNNCDVRMKFSPCNECRAKNLHIIAQGLREHLEETIKRDWTKLDEVLLQFLNLEATIGQATLDAQHKCESRPRCKHCVFRGYIKQLKRLLHEITDELEGGSQ